MSLVCAAPVKCSCYPGCPDGLFPAPHPPPDPLSIPLPKLLPLPPPLLHPLPRPFAHPRPFAPLGSSLRMFMLTTLSRPRPAAAALIRVVALVAVAAVPPSVSPRRCRSCHQWPNHIHAPAPFKRAILLAPGVGDALLLARSRPRTGRRGTSSSS